MLNNIKIYSDNKSIVYLEGNVNFQNCMYIREKYKHYTNKKNVTYIDLKNLQCEDSSIILVIINMIRLSKPKKVKLVNTPNFLTKIINSYKLEKILI